MKFYPFRPQHLDLFEWQESQRDYLRFKRADYLCRLSAGVGWTGVDDLGIVGCAGLVPEPYGLAAWAAFSDRISPHAKTIVRHVRRVFANRSERVIRATVERGNIKAARFAEVVGFSLECSPAGDDPDHVGLDLYRLER